MHPAVSVIIFSTISGLGFGMMMWLGLGVPSVEGWVAATFCALALGLAAIGLVSSTFHLGNPQRAWRAFSQWRSSWLSREGVVAVAACGAFFLYGALWAFGDARIGWLGGLSALLALGTVVSTAMIYGQLKTVPRWNQWHTPVLYVLYALTGGAMLASATDAAAALLLALWGVQIFAWTDGDGAFARSGSTLQTATGLGAIGQPRLLEPPHTGRNYLLDEMVYRVARNRARALRIVALVLGGVLPFLIMATLESLPLKHAMAGLAVISHVAGVFASRWLFFAEAEHVVGLYYGRTT